MALVNVVHHFQTLQHIIILILILIILFEGNKETSSGKHKEEKEQMFCFGRFLFWVLHLLYFLNY